MKKEVLLTPCERGVRQGSDNLEHWRVNLTFDPVTFEDPALGVKVGHARACNLLKFHALTWWQNIATYTSCVSCACCCWLPSWYYKAWIQVIRWLCHA
jgi:hypothetical protein